MYKSLQDANYIVAMVGSSISLLTSGFIIYMYSTRKLLQSFSCKLTRYLCITDFFLSICNLYLAFILPSFEGTWLCYVQAVCITYFLLSSILCTAAISHALHTVTITLNPDFLLMERRYLVMIFGVPVIALFLPLVENEYGPNEGWCWISSQGGGPTTLRIICYYIPLFIVIAYNFIQYRRIIQELYDGHSDVIVSKRLKLYPWILIFTQTALILHRIIYFFADETWQPLAFVGVLLATLMGFCNSILYGFNETLMDYVKNCCTNRDNLENSQESLDQSEFVQNSLNQ